MHKFLMNLFCLFVFVAVGSVSAATLEGVTLPDTATVGGKNLLLNGLGLREKFFVDVYVGGLYLEKKATTSDAVMAETGPYRIVMHMLHDVSHDQFADAWLEDIQANNKDEYPKLEAQAKQFVALFDDAKDGDMIVMDFVPGMGLSVTHNDKLMGSIAGDAFARAILHCYVGPHPPTEELKEGLLGGSD